MNKLIGIFGIFIFSLSCACLSVSADTELKFVGCYASTDASLYNRAALVLFKSNKYRIKTDGDVGSWGEIYGKWKYENNQIIFEPENEVRIRVQANPLMLYVSGGNSELYLSYSKEQKLDEYSASGWTPFVKEECKL